MCRAPALEVQAALAEHTRQALGWVPNCADRGGRVWMRERMRGQDTATAGGPSAAKTAQAENCNAPVHDQSVGWIAQAAPYALAAGSAGRQQCGQHSVGPVLVH